MTMARKYRRPSLSGWLVLDKPSGMTSNQALGRVKWLLGEKKAGHAGTLDPLATGCLPIAFGEATKSVPYVVDDEKAYRFTVAWGAETNTDDSEGETVNTSDARPSEVDIAKLLTDFTGDIEQVPPQFSAVKIDGERAYKRAREGEAIEIAARPVFVESLDIEAHTDASTTLTCVCGKGTYVRAIARDLGRGLRCFGHVSMLRRLWVGPFAEAQMVTMDELEAAYESGGNDEARAYVQPVEAGLDALDRVDVHSGDAGRLRRGQSILLRGRDAPILDQGFVYVMSADRLVALAEAHGAELRPRRIFDTA